MSIEPSISELQQRLSVIVEKYGMSALRCCRGVPHHIAPGKTQTDEPAKDACDRKLC